MRCTAMAAWFFTMSSTCDTRERQWSRAWTGLSLCVPAPVATIILSGSMSRGSDVLAAQAIGADLAYFGTRFIATEEANAPLEYKEMIVSSKSADIVYTSLFTGVHGSYLRGSIENAGLDPDDLPDGGKDAMNFGSGDSSKAKAWRDIWGAGQGVGSMHDIPKVRELILRLEEEYREVSQQLCPA